MNIELKKLASGNYLHKTGRLLQLYLEKGETHHIGYDQKPEKEDMYVLLDKDGYDLVGEYMTFDDAINSLKQDIIDQKSHLHF